MRVQQEAGKAMEGTEVGKGAEEDGARGGKGNGGGDVGKRVLVRAQDVGKAIGLEKTGNG